LSRQHFRNAKLGHYPIRLNGKNFLPQKGEWKTHQEGMARLILANRVQAIGNTPRYVRFIEDFPAFPLNNIWSDTVVAGYASQKVYIVETHTRVRDAWGDAKRSLMKAEQTW
jgi:adenine-specific DNA-methyltransferase